VPVPNHAVRDRKQKPESATILLHSSAEELAVATITSRPLATSNHVRSMEDGPIGTNGVLVARAVVEENKSEHVNAATPPPNTVAKNAQERPASHETATKITVPSMVDGPNGVCGENAR